MFLGCWFGMFPGRVYSPEFLPLVQVAGRLLNWCIVLERSLLCKRFFAALPLTMLALPPFGGTGGGLVRDVFQDFLVEAVIGFSFPSFPPSAADDGRYYGVSARFRRRVRRGSTCREVRANGP